MNIYLLDDPMTPSEHPNFGHLGTWSDGRSCKTCGHTTERLIEPLLVQWFDGSDVIGDFSWCGYTAVVLDHVRDWFVKNGFEVRFGKSVVVKPHGRAKMPRVAFPYQGPDLHWLISTKTVRLDEERSGIAVVPNCPECGQSRTKFVREDIYIPRANWNGERVFRIEQNEKSSAKFITEEAFDLLAGTNFNNYVAVPAGRIGD